MCLHTSLASILFPTIWTFTHSFWGRGFLQSIRHFSGIFESDSELMNCWLAYSSVYWIIILDPCTRANPRIRPCLLPNQGECSNRLWCHELLKLQANKDLIIVICEEGFFVIVFIYFFTAWRAKKAVAKSESVCRCMEEEFCSWPYLPGYRK